MAQRDYVSRSRSSGGKSKTGNRRRKGSSSSVSKTMIALAISVLVTFFAGLYFLTHHQPGNQVLPMQTQHTGSGLPPKPEERWRYIKELENRQLGVIEPTEPSGGGLQSHSELTSEQRQLLEQMQLDMRQQPTQLSEVPYNAQTSGAAVPPQNARRLDERNNTKPLDNAQGSGVSQDNSLVAPPVPSSRQVAPKTLPSANKEKLPPIVASKKEQEKEVEKKWQIQCGSFRGTDQAESVRAQLAFGGVESRIITGGGWNRVLLGPYSSRMVADKMLQRLKGDNMSGCIVLASGG